MGTVAAKPAFQPPAIPWLTPQPLGEVLPLGLGLEHLPALQNGLRCLCDDATVQAVLAFGSRGRGSGRADSDLDLAVITREASLDPALKTQRWLHSRELLGVLPVDVDLVVQGAADAERLAGSRWHVMGDVAREGRVLYVAS
jgi:predicted nucleotidyltransferase